MILQALNEYYQRKTRLPVNNLAPPGFEHKSIPFLIVLTADGNFAGLDDTREGEGKKKVAKIYLVPQTVKRSSGVAANLLWDHPGYVFGVDGKGKLERAQEQHSAFLEAIRSRFAASDDVGIQAVLSFLEHGDFESVFLHPLWPEIQETGANLTFRLEGDSEPVCERPVVMTALSTKDDSVSEKTSLCLVLGEEDVIERLHPSIKGVWGAQSSGASIVSFNLDAFSSYGKTQGGNAPVGKRAVFSYTTALNHLLAKDSKQRIQVGDASTVFWADTPEHPMEELFSGFFSEPPKDNPDLGISAVAALLSAPRTGAGSFEDDGTPFYVLGLAPNAARIAVRFWHIKTVGELAVNIRRHFDDLRIVHAPHEPETLSLFRLLVATAMLGKSENIPPNLGGDVMRNVIEGLPYPQTLLSGAIRRIRAEHEVTYPRASIIKACINRQSGKEKLKVSLDENNTNSAYRLGRLFAVLEKIQEVAQPNINATIRDRFYGAASSTPVSVFSTLLKLKNHHVAKLDERGRKILYRAFEDNKPDDYIAIIFNNVPDFPTHLNLQDQGRFAIGYYHQRQAFFAKSEPTTNKGE
ncbi:type I-C CRISPR-associated protein Cas8c/Csd1 [Nitrosomonas communis]|uniref:CRISPR-associated protein Csd1 n=1 Tax=Nitrosomonas communis TaxID=44574 RepID=A0A1H2Q0Y3_9PROT|nr:type I-C CRISPR-associated protein Cas8c/Csd1 [Nitrosomonas communis]SDW00159.1 CRISPR-associated protein Csd1 [Nitrosomonas communis]